MRPVIGLLGFVLGMFGSGWVVEASEAAVKPEEAQQKLVEGNERFVKHKVKHPDQGVERLKEVAEGQHPFAVVLGCADSRVPPEVVFDQGLGDLFVVRVAGNSPDDEVIGSIEYAVEHLGASLIVVLGHEKCGAVKAAVDGGKPEGHVGALLDPIKPAVAEAKKMAGDVVHNAVSLHVRHVVEQLRYNKPILAEEVEHGKIRVVGAAYDLDTGRVGWIGESLH